MKGLDWRDFLYRLFDLGAVFFDKQNLDRVPVVGRSQPDTGLLTPVGSCQLDCPDLPHRGFKSADFDDLEYPGFRFASAGDIECPV